MKQNILTVLILLCVILTTVIPLQAAERINVFERKKPSDTSSGDSETSPANKSKVNPEQQKTVDNIAKALQRGTSGTMLSYYYFILLIFFILCLVLFYLLHELYWEQYVVSRENPWNLFRELCSAHKLNKSERQLLRQIAEEQQWENPLQIFIDPLHLKSALDHKRFEKSYSMIEALLIKLFDLDMKDELLIKTQVIEHSTSPLATTIIYRQDEKHKKEHSEIRTTK